MSTPVNHHYVSQCHSRLFFNNQERKIYCYDKELDNYFYKTTTKSLFSEDYSNTRTAGSELDHKTLEEQLNAHFERDFEKHASNVIELAEDPSKNDDSKSESLYYLACYALISDVRIPQNKRKADEGLDSLMLETAKKVRLLGDEIQAKAIEDSIAKSKNSKYSSTIPR